MAQGVEIKSKLKDINNIKGKEGRKASFFV